MANKHKHVSQIVSINLGRTPIGDSYFLSPEANLGKTPIGGRTPIGWRPPNEVPRTSIGGWLISQCVHMTNY